MTKLNLVNAKEEINYSKSWLEDTTGTEILHMSYPHGAVNQEIIHEVKKCGYISACSSKPGLNAKKLDIFNLSRTSILSHDHLNQFVSKLNGDWDWTKWL